MNLMSELQVGMPVVEADGTRIGTVEEFQWGDPQATTAQGQMRHVGRGPFGCGARYVREPGLPDEGKELLLRGGYVRVRGKGLFRQDRFVAADRFDRIQDDVLYLRERPR